MGLSIGPTIGVEGADKFQLAFKEMSATAGKLQSEMDALTASFRDNDSALKQNTEVSKQLTKQIYEQNQIVDKATEGYAKSKQAVIDAAYAVEQSKKDYEAAGQVMVIFEKQYENAVEVQKRQVQAVEETKQKLADARAVVQQYADDFKKMVTPLREARDAQAKVTEEARLKWKEAEKAASDAAKEYGRFSQEAKDARKVREELHKTYQDEKEKLEQLTKAVEDCEKAHNKNSEEVKAAQKNVNDLKEELKNEEAELKRNSAETNQHKKALNDARKEYDGLERAITTAEKKFDVARITAAKWGDVMNTARAKLEEFKKKLEELPKTLGSVGEDFQKTGDAIAELGESMSKVLAPMTALASFGVKGALTFTDALAKISTIADTSKVSLDEFGTGIKQLASDTGFATDDIAAAVYQALSAAVSTEDALEFTAGAADLARAGFLDMYGSVDVLTTILNAYHLQVKDVAHISDVLVKTQDRGKTTVNELAQAMGNVIPTAAQYGITVEDLGAAYVVLTKQGINTARSTTYLRSAFTELEKEGSDASEALKNATGKSFMQLMKEGKNLGQIMQILRDAVNGDEEAFIHLFGSVRTAAGALALANTSAYEYNEILNDVSNSNGQAARNVQKLQTPTLKMKKAWEQLKTTGIELGQELVELLTPAFEKVVKAIRKATDWFKGLNKGTKTAIATFVGITGALGPVVLGIGKLTKGLGKAMVVVAKVIAGGASLANVLMVTATAIGLVVAGLMTWKVKLSEETEELRKVREAEWGLTEEMKEHIAASQELIDQSRSVRSASEETVRGNMAEAQAAQALLGQLRELYDADGNVLKGKEAQAEFIKGALADALGIEISKLDELIEKNGIYSKSIDEVIEAELKKANADAYLQAYEQQIQKLAELQFARDEAFADFKTKSDDEKKALDEATLAWQEYKDAEARGVEGEELQTFAHAWSEAEANLKTAQSAMDESKTSYENLNRAIDEGSGQLDYYMQKVMEASGMTEEEAKKATDSASGTITEFKDKNKETYDQIVADTESSLGDYRQKIEDAKQPIQDAAKADAGAVTGEFDSATNSMPGRADSLVDAYYNALIAPRNINKLIRGGRILADSVDTGYTTEQDEHSPSRVWMGFADDAVDGFVIGAEKRLGDLVGIGRQMAMATNSDASFASSYSRTGFGFDTNNISKTISAPISVNVNVNGNLDNPQSLVDSLEEMLVEKIIRNERVFA